MTSKKGSDYINLDKNYVSVQIDLKKPFTKQKIGLNEATTWAINECYWCDDKKWANPTWGYWDEWVRLDKDKQIWKNKKDKDKQIWKNKKDKDKQIWKDKKDKDKQIWKNKKLLPW